MRGMGWIPQHDDDRDVPIQTLMAKLGPQHELPMAVDLRPKFPVPTFDQGDIGSCTANSVCTAAEFLTYQHRGAPRIEMSRLWLYYASRDFEGTANQDSGAMLRDVIKVGATQGLCGEWAWPYAPAKYTVKPPAYAYKNALTHPFSKYYSIPPSTRAHDAKAALAAGFPVIFGFTVYESFESAEVANTGIVSMPKSGEAQIGGHAVLCMGYDTAKESYLVRNSWGDGWGDQGFFHMPAAYFENPSQAHDFWVLQQEQGL